MKKKYIKRVVSLFLLWVIAILGACSSQHLLTQEVPSVLRKGETILLSDSSQASLDLDELSADTNTHDIQLQIGGHTNIFILLVPQNEALSYPFYSTNDYINKTEMIAPNYNDCEEKMSIFSAGSIVETFDGNFICILTNEANLAQIRIGEISTNEFGQISMNVSYITWDTALQNELD